MGQGIIYAAPAVDPLPLSRDFSAWGIRDIEVLRSKETWVQIRGIHELRKKER